MEKYRYCHHKDGGLMYVGVNKPNRERRVARSVLVSECGSVIVDEDEDGNMIGVEIVGLADLPHKDCGEWD